MLTERIKRGQSTGVICSEEQARDWMEQLKQVPLFRLASDEAAYFFTGATVTICTTPEQAERAEGKRKIPMWIDEAGVLDAPLPAPKTPKGE